MRGIKLLWTVYLDWYERTANDDHYGMAAVGCSGVIFVLVFGAVAFEGPGPHPTWAFVMAAIGGALMVGTVTLWIGNGIVGGISCAIRDRVHKRSSR